MATSERTPAPSMTTRARVGTFADSLAGRHSIPSAAPTSSPPARVSVPSYARVLSNPGVAMSHMATKDTTARARVASATRSHRLRNSVMRPQTMSGQNT